MSPQLVNLDLRFARALAPLNLAQTSAAPAARPGKWTIQQVVEHLLLTYQSTCQLFEGRIAKATPTRATPSLYQRAGQITVLRFGWFPSGRTAPATVTPPFRSNPQSGAQLAASFHAALTTMDALIAQAELCFGSRRRAISHQVLGPLSISQWRAFHLVHGLHHLKQIQAISAQMHPHL